MAIPKPPVNSMTDFVVFAFVTIVTVILFSAVAGIFLSIIFNPSEDRSQIVAILADVTTSLIAALVGFLAGKGTGHVEAQEAQAAEKQAERDYEVAKMAATTPTPPAGTPPTPPEPLP